jgi:hypothetical protein
MENQSVAELIIRFNAGLASEKDKAQLERFIESGAVSIEDLESLQVVDRHLANVQMPAPSAELDHRFYNMLAEEKRKPQPFSWRHFFSWPEFAPKLALASVTLIVGVLAGYLLRSPDAAPAGNQIEALSQQVSDLQEMMMLSLLEKESATDRLKAVNLTQEMGEASIKVTNALIRTLNEDDNVNVRLAALDALKPFVNDSKVREALVRSIARQESPLVQVSMAELMVALQEKSAVKEFEKIVGSDKTPADVKKKIKQTMEVLI